MRTQTQFADLSPDDLDALCKYMDASPDELTGKLLHSSSDQQTNVKVIDDCGDESPCRINCWYVFGHEYGATHVIRARGESSAYEIWVDEQLTIAPDEVHEAYGAFDKLVKWLVARGHEETSTLRGFANRYASLFFTMSIAKGADNVWDEWPLLEGYEMQSNSTDTGIVNVGHYAWYHELATSDYTVKLSGAIS